MNGRGFAVLALIGLLCAGVVLAGCGGDSGTSAAATEEPSAPLSKPQFVKQAEEICEEGVKKKDKAVSAGLKDLSAQAQGTPDPQEIGAMVEETVIPSYSQVVDQLGGLGAPKGDEAEVKKMVAKFESALQSAEADPAKATEVNPFTAADKAAAAYGIETCRL